MSDEKISYQEYIPTDRWSLQDWYLGELVRLNKLYVRITLGRYIGGEDRRTIAEFYAVVHGYFAIARKNIEKHLTAEEMGRFMFLKATSVDKVTVAQVDELMGLIGTFNWNSGLSKLSESKPLGPFAYARARRGLDSGSERDDD